MCGSCCYGPGPRLIPPRPATRAAEIEPREMSSRHGIFRFRVLILFSLEQAEALESQKYLPAAITMDEVFFKECLIELLQDMFEEELVTKALAEDTVTVNVDNENAVVSLQNMTVNIWFFSAVRYKK